MGTEWIKHRTNDANTLSEYRRVLIQDLMRSRESANRLPDTNDVAWIKSLINMSLLALEEIDLENWIWSTRKGEWIYEG